MNQRTGDQVGTFSLPPIGTAELLARDDETEYGLPQGLDVPGYEDAPYAEGGRYKPKSPDCSLNIGVGHRM